MRQHREAGFTLVELLVVMAIIAILAAIAVPAYGDYVLRSKLRMAQSDLLALSVNVEAYRQRTLGTYPASADTAKKGWSPGTKTGDFTYAYTATNSGLGYTLTAVAGETLGKASGCTLTLNSGNARTTSDQCMGVGWQ